MRRHRHHPQLLPHCRAPQFFTVCNTEVGWSSSVDTWASLENVPISPVPFWNFKCSLIILVNRLVASTEKATFLEAFWGSLQFYPTVSRHCQTNVWYQGVWSSRLSLSYYFGRQEPWATDRRFPCRKAAGGWWWLIVEIYRVPVLDPVIVNRMFRTVANKQEFSCF